MNRLFVYFLSTLLFTYVILLPAKSNIEEANQDKTKITKDTVLKGTAKISDVLSSKTKLKITLSHDINALENEIGDEFRASILNDVNVNDVNIIPVGSIVIGHIEDIMHSGKASMQGTMEIALDKIVLPSGKYIPLKGARIAANKTYTNKSRDLKGEGNGLARGVGLSALKGATLTFIPGNKAVKSAAVGIAATGAVFSGGWSIGSTATIGGLTGLYYGIKKHGKEVMVASGQELEIELSSDQDLTPIEGAEVAIDDVMGQPTETTDSIETIIK